ncbi:MULTISPECIES: imidazole glycerol phosphate synthase subunit HisH [Hyphomonas]|uniref:Imidazole glycerol phosphate synthase subunit HisH n=1 Tax=Hyphomonas adhaerens TaxID=81029 RepID=A0A3B9GTJ6_9PROT|nr:MULTISPECIES: imidazole glycerol phosphate synthase subunit HisH [Hyphomonas]MBB39354.1 imidazole glycerol phosphate synthase subunit HisH [Hyphomonas sp.]HAE25743.1 imidazole glycerol phosphate synthase subunit HisH [Hyphomonas adhaerens]|tara:strand:- start:5249 stop:5890 length:642 start_codon:yes stop_codon:yes gene_type:complete
MTQVALIDYGSGNLHSAERALREAAALAGTSHEIVVTDSPDVILESTRIVLPGVGHFADCAAGLRARDGVVDALNEAVLKEAKPFFGICVGMQLMATAGLEDGYTAGLGWIKGTVDIIAPGEGYRIPHMGWNGLEIPRPHPVLADLGDDPHVYFTHSYAMKPDNPADIAATADYGHPIVAAVARRNMFGTQFHPEKSQATGLKILSNFLQWAP